MPLTATFDPGHNHFPSENVYFFRGTSVFVAV